MLNHVVLIGRLVADPEIRYTQSGIPVANICIAVDRKFRNASGERDTDFINIVAWRKLAELLEKYMKKGRLIAVQGTLQMRKYQTREGENRTTYEVQADSIEFLDRADKGNYSGMQPPPPSDSDAPPEPDQFPPPDRGGEEDDDLPF